MPYASKGCLCSHVTKWDNKVCTPLKIVDISLSCPDVQQRKSKLCAQLCQCLYRVKHASWEPKGYIRSENLSGSVCKENMQELWSLSPVSVLRLTLTGELTQLSQELFNVSHPHGP